MANIGSQNIGNLRILIKQGNTQNFKLKFSDVLPDGTKVPIDLTAYTSIKMDIKSKIDVALTAFISWTVGNGLTIEGDFDEVLSFTFSNQFLTTNQDKWFYDILFTDGSGKETLIGGEINVKRVVTK